ncbi:hypothetical protein GCM10020366_16690 [Saccharopolyspora gregorii]|uniref:Uncharacterized protein n=1 Tax=Saccharopolyspora gregorii TaxID=33914 RepID=A0ABP6RMC6_9PSEU
MTKTMTAPNPPPVRPDEVGPFAQLVGSEGATPSRDRRPRPAGGGGAGTPARTQSKIVLKVPNCWKPTLL